MRRFSIFLAGFFIIFAALTAPSGTRAETYSPSPGLIGSPALLQDYVAWDKAYTAFMAKGSETRAYADLIAIVYDREINRPWGDQYFVEAQGRLVAFRSRLCPLVTPRPNVCSVPLAMAADPDVTALETSLADPALIQALQARWGVKIAPISLPDADRPLDLEVGTGTETQGETPTFWDLSPRTLSWFSMVPIITDADTYLAGFESGDDFPAMFALSPSNSSASSSGDSVTINDWQIRDRAMVFASHWKTYIGFNKASPPTNPANESEELLYQALYDESAAQFQSGYDQLLPRVQGNADVLARFLKERSQNDYPEEVYQLVAYSAINDLVRVQASYYKLANEQRSRLSARQKSLESLLALQRYGSSWRFFLVDWETLAMPFTTHTAMLDETADFNMATTLSLEQLDLILGLDVYANTDGFARYGYAITADELFSAEYLKANQTAIYQELLLPNGQLKRLSDLSTQDQLRLLQQYLTTTEGQPNEFGISRMSSVFRVRVREKDLRDMADLIHAARSREFQ